LENPWTSLSQKLEYSNPWISIVEHQILNPNGGQGIYGVVHFKNLALGVLALEDDFSIWLVGQFRFPLNQYSWEIPEGGGKVDQDPLEGIKRELKEETGCEANYWFEIQRMHLSNSVSDEYAILFLALGITEGASEPEETEQLNVKKVPFKEAYSMVLKGEITDSMSVAAILKTKILLDESSWDIEKLKQNLESHS